MRADEYVIGIDDDITRRDSMHATINSLPDPNYATLRALTLVNLFIMYMFYRQVLINTAPQSRAGPLGCKSNERREFGHNLWVRPLASLPKRFANPFT